ncbi:MAG: hypothetical protein Q8Q06_02420 [bacterium]|nr:hypothetical protein [bacterium]
MHIGGDIVREDIKNGGSGGDAEVIVQVRNFFPGIGGCIKTKQTTYVALRKEQKSGRVTGSGHKTFLRHLLIKKLDDFFCRNRVYLGPHVTRPFGSASISDTGRNAEKIEASIYEWVWGQDSFPWRIQDSKGNSFPVVLKEWDLFKSVFSGIGIILDDDIVNVDNGNISQNIVHQLCSFNDINSGELNLCWHRIDFGADSLFIDYDKLGGFFKKESDKLKNLLGIHRYELIWLAYRTLSPDIIVSEREAGRLEMLVREFRKSSLRHLDAEIVL